MIEADIQARVRIEATRLGARLFRNHVGEGWHGVVVRHDARAGTVTLRYARRVTFGLGVGSADLIGWLPKHITESDVGKIIAQFGAVEIKTESGTLKKEQAAFIEAVNKAGGIAGVVRSPDALAGLLKIK
jgi:hypothetical protein